MPSFLVEYEKTPGSEARTKEIDATSAETLADRLRSKYPEIHIISIEESPAAESPASDPVMPAPPQAEEDDDDDASAPAIPPKPDPFDAPPTNSSQFTAIPERDIIWSAKVELKDFHPNTLVRLLMQLIELIRLILGSRRKGTLTECSDLICVEVTTWLFWVFKTKEEIIWVRKRSLTGSGRQQTRGFLRMHNFVYFDYSSGTLSGQVLWIKKASLPEIDHAIARWMDRG